MSAPRGTSGTPVCTTAGAAAETAREAAFLARRIAGSGSACPEFAPAHLAAFLRRCARNLEACVAAMRDRELEAERLRLRSRALHDLIEDGQERLL